MGQLPIVISYRLEGIRRRWTDLDDKRRIEALEQLWNEEKFKKEAGILAVGDELNVYYFFRESAQSKEFKTTSDEWLSRSRVHIEAAPKVGFSEFDRMVIRNLMLAAESLRRRGESTRLKKLIEEFEENYKGRDVRFTMLSHYPPESCLVLIETYKNLMGNHWTEMQQRRVKAEPEPTPAR